MNCRGCPYLFLTRDYEPYCNYDPENIDPRVNARLCIGDHKVAWQQYQVEREAEQRETQQVVNTRIASLYGLDEDSLDENEEQVKTREKRVRRRKASYDEWNAIRYRGHNEPLRQHQLEALARYKDEADIALFFEVGSGKSATALAIAAYKFRKGDINSLLIVSKNGVHTQWAVEQVPEWLPDDIPREVQCFGGDGGASETHPFTRSDALHILIVNIDTFSTVRKWMDIAQWHNLPTNKCMIILDEATVIKNITSKRTDRMLYAFNDVVRANKRVIKSVPKSVCRCILTGTPATNGAVDLWSIMEFVHPSYFGRNYYSFKSHYGLTFTMYEREKVGGPNTQVLLNANVWERIKKIQEYSEAFHRFGVTEEVFNIIHSQDKFEGAHKNMDELKALLDKVASYKLIRECQDMPEQNYIIRAVKMSDEQQEAYNSMVNKLLVEYEGVTMTAQSKMTALIRLQQISSGFIVNTPVKQVDEQEASTERNVACTSEFDEPDYWFEEQGSYDDFADEVHDLFDADKDYKPSEVVWLGNKIPKLERLVEDIEECSKPCIIVTHFSAEAARIYDALESKHSVCLMTGWRTVGSIEEFKEGKYDVMVANIRVIGHGFNLQNACQMFFYSNTFSLEDRLQVEGRIFRTGQKNTCVYTDYVNEGTIDEKVTVVLQQKRALLDYIRGTSIKELL